MTHTDSDRSRRIARKSTSPSRLTFIGRAIIFVMVGLTVTSIFAAPAAAHGGDGHDVSAADDEVVTVPTGASESERASSSEADAGAARATPTETETETPSDGDDGGGSGADFCHADSRLPDIAQFLIRISLYGGLVGTAVTYYVTTSVEAWDFIGGDTEQRLRQVRKKSTSNGLKLLAVGSIASIGVAAGVFPMASCIDLTPLI